MADDGFFARLHEAEDAGLNKEWALKVAYLEISLADALGGMDHQSESESSSQVADDGYDCGCRGSNSCHECIPF